MHRYKLFTMELEIKSDCLKKVISCASRVTSNKAIQPILNNILLSCSNGSLVVSATDLDLAIECKLPAEVFKKGRITLPAKKLDEIVSKVPGEDVKISIDENKLTKIVSARSRFQINGVSPDDFPEVIKKQEDENILNIKQDELLNAINLTSFATSKFETTSILSGVSFQIDGSSFEIGATDGSRLAKYTGRLSSNDVQTKQSVVIPARALLELERLILAFREGNDNVSFYFMPGQIIFQNNDFSLSTRLITGIFPAYDKLIPSEQSNKLVFSRTALLSGLERVAILSNERTSVIKLILEKGTKAVKLSAHSPDYGNATDEVDAEYNGGDMEIAFNYKYLAEALRNLQLEKLLLELENSLSPLILKPKEKVDYGYTYLIMPVQLR